MGIGKFSIHCNMTWFFRVNSIRIDNLQNNNFQDFLFRRKLCLLSLDYCEVGTKKDLMKSALIQESTTFSLLLAASCSFLRITSASEFRTFLFFCIASVLILLPHVCLIVFIPSILIHSRHRVDIIARPP